MNPPAKAGPARPPARGVIWALISAILFGASTPLTKMFIGSMNPWLLAALLYAGAGGGLAFVTIGRKIYGAGAAEAPLQRADLPWLAIAIAAGGVAAPILLLLGLARTSAADASLLLNLEGLATMAIAWLVFRENVDGRLLLGAAAILSGAGLLSWQGFSGTFWQSGPFYIAGACLGWAIDNNVTRKISGSDPVQIAMLKTLSAGALDALIAWHFQGRLPSLDAAAAVACIGLLGYGVSLVLFVFALRELGAARTSAYFSLAPFIGAALSLVLFHERGSLLFTAAGLCMAVGLWLHLAERHAHEHFHEALDHEHSHTHDAHHQHAHDAAAPLGEPHTHRHHHDPLRHTHVHYPDLHHRHRH